MQGKVLQMFLREQSILENTILYTYIYTFTLFVLTKHLSVSKTGNMFSASD